jgi:hypothetical protein
MKTIIAGSRTITNSSLIFSILDNLSSEIEITEVVCGGAKGVDLIGKDWAIERGIPVKDFLPNWDLYRGQAGFVRNTEMARYADALVAFWDKKSNGTNDMIGKANMLGLNVCIYLMDDTYLSKSN